MKLKMCEIYFLFKFSVEQRTRVGYSHRRRYGLRAFQRASVGKLFICHEFKVTEESHKENKSMTL